MSRASGPQSGKSSGGLQVRLPEASGALVNVQKKLHKQTAFFTDTSPQKSVAQPGVSRLATTIDDNEANDNSAK